ncbi:Gfo/Idh/MocA family protein [Granulicella sp. S190]|uniref:Gfo/Idh/MocA family protein n=1 Tax=Granulicella sp. S190 TaxID=1747226 RepID=UPI00131E9EFA|nr:Gfo/Idh/MocA family oxidoreductase [Granulicella sp. S190]
MIDRRHFLQGLSATAIAADSLIGLGADADTPGLTQAEAEVAKQILPSKDSSPLHIGIIGPGSRGKELVRNFLRVPGIKIVAASDVYAPRFQELNDLCGYPVAALSDFRELCDRKDLDAIVVATPLGLHADHVLAALASGHAVYGEKTMAYTVDQARQIVSAVEAGKRLYQVGHQYRYSPWIRAAIARVQAGEIGTVTHIEGYWHRNNDWRRPVPDPSLERLINWRLYHQWSLGLLAELGSHHIDIANWVFGSTPITALASGSICRYHDGRETDDNVQAVLGYSDGRRFIFNSVTDNAKMGDQLWLYGNKGSLNLTLEDATFFYEPHQIERAKPSAHGEEKGVTTSASYRSSGEMPYRGPGRPVNVTTAEDPTTAATRAFIYCVRTSSRPIADVHVGLGSALAVVQSNQARLQKREIEVPPPSM